ncbi:MAG: NADH-quinone oxidoreductase subunit J [Cyclobacteriaceae bacterium]
MNLETIVFYLFAAIIVVSALLILFTRNVLYAAFLLIFTFMGIAALYVFAGADFLAITQILVYVGGILVLLIFGIMLSHRLAGQPVLSGQHNLFAGVILAVAVFLLVLQVVLRGTFFFQQPNFSPENLEPANNSTIKLLGFQLMTNFVFPFEVVAIILLVALIGAAFLARKQEID